MSEKEIISCHVAVVGAGPAGCTAAMELAEQGREVVVLEKVGLPREKVCGGGLLHRAMACMPCDVGHAIERRLRTVEMHVADMGMQFVARREHPIIHMVTRSEFDMLLCRQAVETGARLMEHCAVRRVVLQQDKVEVEAGEKVIRAEWLVAADGAQSPVARMSGWRPFSYVAPSIECEVKVEKDVLQRFSQSARFDFNRPRHGYGWVFPKRDHLSVGVLSMQKSGQDLKRALGLYLKELGLEECLSRHQRGAVIPVSPRSGPLARHRVLLVGDAAGLVDPVTAEGLSHAILSGRLAAEAILGEGDNARRCEGAYQFAAQQRLLSELRAARFLAWLLFQQPRFRDWVFCRAGNGLVEFMTRLVTGQAGYAETLGRPSNWFKAMGLWK